MNAAQEALIKKFNESPSWYTAAEFAATIEAKNDGDRKAPTKKEAHFEAMKAALKASVRGTPVKKLWNMTPYAQKDAPAIKPSFFKTTDDALAFVGAPFAERKIDKKRPTEAQAIYFIRQADRGDELIEYAKILPGAAISVTTGPNFYNTHVGMTGAYDVGSLTATFIATPDFWVVTDKELLKGRLLAADKVVGDEYCSRFDNWGTTFALPKPADGTIAGAFLTTRAFDPAKAKIEKTKASVVTADLDADGVPDLAMIPSKVSAVVEAGLIDARTTLLNIDGKWVIADSAQEVDCT